MIIKPLGLFLQMTIAIKKLFGILRRRPKPAQAGSVVALLHTLLSSEQQIVICGVSSPKLFLIVSSG